jgi:predicted nucleotidyltransferase
MDVAAPIRSVVPSLDGPVLAVLASTTAPLALADVHRRAGGSKSGIRQVLRRLVGEGIVHDVPGGYLLNRDHVAAAAVELLANLHGELVDRIRSEVERWPEAVDLVGLFGSAARRDGDSTSDIDVLVVSKADHLADLVDHLTERIQAWTGNPAQVLGLTPAHLRRLRRAKEPITAAWDRELVVICGDRRILRGLA